MTGVITRVMLPKGFAFILGDDGREYFFHADELFIGSWDGTTVHEGVRIDFTPAKTVKGLRATEARVL